MEQGRVLGMYISFFIFTYVLEPITEHNKDRSLRQVGTPGNIISVPSYQLLFLLSPTFCVSFHDISPQ